MYRIKKFKIIKNTYRKSGINKVSFFVGIYFMMLPFDIFTISGLGSILRLISFLPLIIILMFCRPWKIRLSSTLKMLMIFILYYAFTVLISTSFEVSVNTFMALFRNVLFIIVISSMYSYDDLEIEFLKKSLVVGGFITIILTLMNSGFSYDNRMSLYVNGIQMDQNTLNGYLMFTWVYFVNKVLVDRKYFYLIALIGVSSFTLFTGSRGALLSFLIVLLFGFIHSIKYSNKNEKTKLWLGIIFLLIILVAVLPYILQYVPNSIISRFSRTEIASGSYRINIWNSLLTYYGDSSILRKVFGFGFGTTPLISAICYGLGIVAHNVWIEQLIAGGLFGLIFTLAFQITALKQSFQTKDYFCIGSYIGFLIMSLTLSIVSYKPMWDAIILIIIISNCKKRNNVKQIKYVIQNL